MKLFSNFLLLILFVAASCTSDGEERMTDRGEDYFPLQVGSFFHYQVDRIEYQQGTSPDTVAYQLMYDVIDSFKSADGTPVYVIHLSTRADVNEQWQFQETWSARVDENNVVVNEGNIPFLKLSFPIEKGATWDGNSFNDLGEDPYDVIVFDEPAEINGLIFEKTLTVEQELNDDPIVYTDLRTEVYAKGVGLVKKETTQLRFCQAQTCAGDELIESGTVFKQQIVDYGIQ